MILVLDNRVENFLSVGVWMDNKFVQETYSVKENNDFLLCVEFFLSTNQIEASQLTGIGVAMGVGKFTATRLLVTLANTLAFALSVPILPISADSDVANLPAMLASAKSGTYILPVYSAPPHISSKQL